MRHPEAGILKGWGVNTAGGATERPADTVTRP